MSQADPDLHELSERRYPVIVKVRYVNMTLRPRFVDRLADGGYFVCEQHLVTMDAVAGPKNPAHRLRAGAPRDAVGDLQVVHYREGIVPEPDGRRAALVQLVGHR